MYYMSEAGMFSFFNRTTRLPESQFSDQGLNQSHSMESSESSPPGHQGTPQEFLNKNVFIGFGSLSVGFFVYIFSMLYVVVAAVAATKSLQLCSTLWNPIDGRPPGSPIPGILLARTVEWVAISFSNA